MTASGALRTDGPLGGLKDSTSAIRGRGAALGVGCISTRPMLQNNPLDLNLIAVPNPVFRSFFGDIVIVSATGSDEFDSKLLGVRSV